jgi:hypothetical protein
MPPAIKKARFTAPLMQPAKRARGEDWAFIVLPKRASELLPRRGRASVEGTLNGHPFESTLEPDGQLSHWLKVKRADLLRIGARVGDDVAVTLWSLSQEPEPDLPTDLAKALKLAPEALRVWRATTTLARVDWIHWIESAQQKATRAKRVAEACDKLAGGQKRVCCFDPSGYYSKAFRAPDTTISSSRESVTVTVGKNHKKRPH